MEKVRQNLYLPKHLKEKIQYLADRELRSWNMQCVYLLSQIIEQRRDDWEDMEQEKQDD